MKTSLVFSLTLLCTSLGFSTCVVGQSYSSSPSISHSISESPVSSRSTSTNPQPYVQEENQAEDVVQDEPPMDESGFNKPGVNEVDTQGKNVATLSPLAYSSSNSSEWVENLNNWSELNAKAWPALHAAAENALSDKESQDLSNLPILHVGSQGRSVQILISVLQRRGFLAIPDSSSNLNAPTQGSDTSEPTLSDSDVVSSNQISEFSNTPVPNLFDDSVKQAVELAQTYYGLVDDGTTGPQLYLNLKLTNADRQKALSEWALKIEEFIQTARDEGAHHLIVVNIPSYTLHLISLDNGHTLLESRVIIGMPTRRTPRFRTNVVNLKYNPDWTPPPSLVARGRHHVPPGIHNPLGLLRFSTNNNLNIYLHDTDEHELFEKSNRALSSGCIRVQEWKALASILSNSTVPQVEEQVSQGKTHFEKITPIPVFIAYSVVDTQSMQSNKDEEGEPIGQENLTPEKAAAYPDIYHLIGSESVSGEEVLNPKKN